MLPDDQVRILAVTAVNHLIAQVKTGYIDQNHELAEIIAGCIRDTKPRHLDTVQLLLDGYEGSVPAIIGPEVLNPR